jgi:hypothetical protein
MLFPGSRFYDIARPKKQCRCRFSPFEQRIALVCFSRGKYPRNLSIALIRWGKFILRGDGMVLNAKYKKVFLIISLFAMLNVQAASAQEMSLRAVYNALSGVMAPIWVGQDAGLFYEARSRS